MNINKLSSAARPPGETPLHQAVSSHSPETVEKLRAEGQRPVHLDDKRESPIDRLSKMRDIDQSARKRMHSALLKSLNPGAPAGYIKPEMLHGSPWGLEILSSGSLKGGVNDKKGGIESLEGKVFFSDRTPETASDNVTRTNFRKKARVYSEGKGINPSNATSRAIQHRISQVWQRSIPEGRTPFIDSTDKLTLEEKQTEKDGFNSWMQNYIHNKTLSINLKSINNMTDEQLAVITGLPKNITVTLPDGSSKQYRGEMLKERLSEAAAEVTKTMEQGKAPVLSMINSGKIVPLVFGFSKIDGLKQHQISGLKGSEPTLFHYQDESHPLTGNRNGGKLQEIEIKSIQDLATLFLGCRAKGADIPDGVVIRIKYGQSKADYMDSSEMMKLQGRINDYLNENKFTPETSDMKELQAINKKLRDEINHL